MNVEGHQMVDRFEPPNEPDLPCEVCGQSVDNCICPECPVCAYQGDPKCYDPSTHGLVRTQEQIRLLDEAVAAWAKQNDEDSERELIAYEEWSASVNIGNVPSRFNENKSVSEVKVFSMTFKSQTPEKTEKQKKRNEESERIDKISKELSFNYRMAKNINRWHQ